MLSCPSPHRIFEDLGAIRQHHTLARKTCSSFISQASFSAHCHRWTLPWHDAERACGLCRKHESPSRGRLGEGLGTPGVHFKAEAETRLSNLAQPVPRMPRDAPKSIGVVQA